MVNVSSRHLIFVNRNTRCWRYGLDQVQSRPLRVDQSCSCPSQSSLLVSTRDHSFIWPGTAAGSAIHMRWPTAPTLSHLTPLSTVFESLRLGISMLEDGHTIERHGVAVGTCFASSVFDLGHARKGRESTHVDRDLDIETSRLTV